MKHKYIANIAEFEGQDVTFHGWVYSKRSSGKIWFLMLRDGTGMTQCVVVKSEVSEEVFNIEPTLTQESSLSVTGTVRKDDRSVGGFELTVKDIKTHQIAEEYPISPKEHGTAFLMDHRHLWLRSKKQHAILGIRNQIIKACRDFFEENGFTLIDTPIFTANACEGTSNLFNVEYFDRTAYLTQSGQLYGEAAAMAFGKIYCFGPTFRAEKSKTRRHLTEFWMIEPEIAFCDLDENMEWAERLVAFILERCLDRCEEQLKTLERDVTKLKAVSLPFPRITYDDAVEI